MEAITEFFQNTDLVTPISALILRLVVALAIYIVGRWIARIIHRWIVRIMNAKEVDPTAV